MTDDNPRGEDPAAVRREIMAAVPEATEIGDRAQAIEAAVAMLKDGDLLVVAGKGHEAGQDRRRPGAAVRRPRRGTRRRRPLGGAAVMNRPTLWTADQASQATGGQNVSEWSASGVSIDSRTLEPGDLFIALEGPSFDGHNFITAALDAGAAAAMVHRKPDGLSESAPLLVVKDTLEALKALGMNARTRSPARFIGVTGSVGKTGTKEALRHCLAGPRHRPSPAPAA